MTTDEALGAFPPALGQAVRVAAADDVDTALMLNEMVERQDRFTSPAAAVLAAVCQSQTARARFERTLDQMTTSVGTAGARFSWPEVVVGGGAHAAVYCAVRRALGFPAPLVLDDGRRFGGTFAASQAPAWNLNSRNRPGPLGLPGSGQALNVLPGAPMQPADIGGSEYQTNADLGLIIRCTLAMSAVVNRSKVERVAAPALNGPVEIVTADDQVIVADRVIVATGLGNPRTFPGAADGRVLDFLGLMRRWDRPFPLDGLGRVAVIGAGDSARCAVEALAGQGPTTGGSVAALAFPGLIDWYGCPAPNRSNWRECNRTRYQGIGALLPRSTGEIDQAARIRPMRRAERVTPGYDAVRVDGNPYDTVVTCIGYERQRFDVDEIGQASVFTGGRRLGRYEADGRVLTVGAAAGLGWEEDEDRRVPENIAGLFRLAPRTADLAALLGAADIPYQAPS